MKIFISYRRFDSIAYAGRIHDRLVATYGENNVFKDVDDIRMGQDFRTILTREVSKCDVLLVLIGRTWLDARDANSNRRLDDVDDFVRTEIRAGLRRANCLVIPVLLNGAQMPQSNQLPDDLRELAYKNAVTIRDDPDFHRDMVRLIDGLNRYADEINRPTELPDEPPHPPIKNRISVSAIVIVVTLVALGITLRAIFAPKPTSIPTATIAPEQSLTPLLDMSSPTATIIATSTPSETPIPTDTQTLTPEPPTVVPTDTLIPTSEPPTVMPTDDLSTTALSLAERGVTANSEWIPYIQEFNGIQMVLVPAGCYTIGANPQEDNERNGNRICFDEPFWIDKTEVNQAQFSRFNGKAVDNPSFLGISRPVERITWFEARDFCTLRAVRLPTEAEWEYAARGPDELEYPWGGAWNTNAAQWNRNSNDGTANVGSFVEGASWVGALDMSGNVLEWVSSLYLDYPYGDYHEDVTNRTDGRVLRGGSWLSSSSSLLRTADRDWNYPSGGYSNIGFRCARNID